MIRDISDVELKISERLHPTQARLSGFSVWFFGAGALFYQIFMIVLMLFYPSWLDSNPEMWDFGLAGYALFAGAVIFGAIEASLTKRVLLTFRHQGRKKSFRVYGWSYWGSNEDYNSIIELTTALVAAVEEFQRDSR